MANTHLSFRRGFPLIELLVVIAIIAILAALIFPVFARAKRSAQQTTCLSNLSQIGKAISLYMADYDDIFPHAVDPIDQVQPQIWSDFPQFQALIPQMPTIMDALNPYTKSREVWKCPADTGSLVMDDRPFLPFPTAPSMYTRTFTSYFYRTEIAFRQLSNTNFELPAQVNILFDAFGHWHGDGGAMRADVSPQEYTDKLRRYRYNVLFGDFHAKSQSFFQLQEAWSVTVQ